MFLQEKRKEMMKNVFKKTLLGLFAGLVLTSCMDDATVVTRNVIKAADNFEVNRRIVFYNGITGEYILVIEGLCSMDVNQTGRAFSTICKVGPTEFKRHTLVLSDNVTAFVEQVDAVKASPYFYRVTFKPTTIIPNIDLRIGGE